VKADATLKVSFELSARDLKYFRERLQLARSGKHASDEETVLKRTQKLIEEAVASEPPEFVRSRLTTLERLVEMLNDSDWRLEGRDRARILDALTYFADPDDMISDRTPGLGYLDDAIMIELVGEELKHEIKAYEDFCAIREKRAAEGGARDLEASRETLQARMRRRRRRDRETLRERGGVGRFLDRLW
jgi:uncharacterized membrane protein YkvA (DUF1232 family)